MANHFVVFVPFVLTSRRTPNAVRVVKEGILIRDLTMPHRDWSIYDALAKGRYVSDRASRVKTADNVTPITAALLKRQAQ